MPVWVGLLYLFAVARFMPVPAAVLATILTVVAVALLERLVLTTPRRRRVGALLGAGAILAWILVLPFAVPGE